MRVLVIGANGKTGRLMTEQLQEKGYDVTAMIRKEKQKSNFDSLGVETVVADLKEDFSYVFRNKDAVLFAASAGMKVTDINAIDRDGVIKACDHAKGSGCRRFVLISSRYADRPDDGPVFLKAHLKAKNASDNYLAESGLDYTIIRPGGLTDEAGTGCVQAASRLETEHGRVSRSDVAAAAAASLEINNTVGKAFELLAGNHPIVEALKSL